MTAITTTVFDVATLRLYLNMDDRTINDRLLGLILAATKGYCSTYTGRQLDPLPALVSDGSDPPTLTDVADPATVQRFPIDRLVRVPDAREITEVRVDGSITHGWSLVGGTPAPYLLLPWESRPRKVLITGRFGFTELPPELVDAIYVQAARNFKERDAGYADTVEIGPDGGAVSYFRQLLPRVRATYDLYVIPESQAESVKLTGWPIIGPAWA